MQSADIKGMCPWIRWDRDALNPAPSFAGVYVLRTEAGKEIERLIGSSDILYIGSSKKSTIRARLTCHFRTNYPLGRICKEVGDVEVSWRLFETENDVQLCESELIARYEQDHIELPPLNRSQPLAKLQQLRRSVPDAVYKQMIDVARKSEPW